MPKVPVLNSKEVIKLLEENGFVLERAKGSHRLYFNEKTNKKAIVPFHNKDLPTGTLLEILRQAGISKDEILK